jgi:hypothetical protein
VGLSPPVLKSVVPVVPVEITDGKTGGDKNIIQEIETTGTTGGKTGGDKHTIKMTEKSFLWCAYHLQFYHQ